MSELCGAVHDAEHRSRSRGNVQGLSAIDTEVRCIARCLRLPKSRPLRQQRQLLDDALWMPRPSPGRCAGMTNKSKATKGKLHVLAQHHFQHEFRSEERQQQHQHSRQREIDRAAAAPAPVARPISSTPNTIHASDRQHGLLHQVLCRTGCRTNSTPESSASVSSTKPAAIRRNIRLSVSVSGGSTRSQPTELALRARRVPASASSMREQCGDRQHAERDQRQRDMQLDLPAQRQRRGGRRQEAVDRQQQRGQRKHDHAERGDRARRDSRSGSAPRSPRATSDSAAKKCRSSAPRCMPSRIPKCRSARRAAGEPAPAASAAAPLEQRPRQRAGARRDKARWRAGRRRG